MHQIQQDQQKKKGEEKQNKLEEIKSDNSSNGHIWVTPLQILPSNLIHHLT